MSGISILSFAKINLSIDVGAKDSEGYHDVDMIMHELSFHDDVNVSYEPYGDDAGSGSFSISLKTNRRYLPTDGRNLAYRAAEIMIEEYGNRVRPGKVSVDIVKRIPVAAGLAGGSGNGAAVLHALNILWDLGLGISELAALGERLGSDVPFCLMGEARGNRLIWEKLNDKGGASTCMRAKGRGTILSPVTPLEAWAVIAKPRLSVSTREVYAGIDDLNIEKRPDNDILEDALKVLRKAGKGSAEYAAAKEAFDANLINVLEEYTLSNYPEVASLKEEMEKAGAQSALMSGSGPTVFGFFDDVERSKEVSSLLRGKGYEAYFTRTIT